MKRFAIASFWMVLVGITAIFSQVQEGRGTWYETDSKGLTASHANLPFGTRVRVTNLQNERQVIVTINNRIVETPNRLIDISKAAADNLEMNPRGTTPVRIEVLSRRAVPVADPPPQEEPDTPPPVIAEPVEEDPPPSNLEEVPVPTTTAVAQYPAVQQEPPQRPSNPGIVNQTIITINGRSVGIPEADFSGAAASAGVNPPYVSSPDGTSAIADAQPSVVSVSPSAIAAPAPSVVSPVPAVVSPAPSVVSPAPVVVAPAPAIISPIVVPPVIAQPVLAPPVLAPPVLAEPVLSNPVISEPIVSNPVVSEPVVSKPVVSKPVVSRPIKSKSLRTPPTVTASPPTVTASPPTVTAAPPPVRPPSSVPRPQGEVIPARISPRKPDPRGQAIYRVQVGAFLDERNAMEAYKRLIDAGFSPSYERYDNYFRVVLSRIRAGEIENVAWRLGAAHFSEVFIREER